MVAMLGEDYWIYMGVGGLFLLLGIVAIVWGNLEQSGYYRAVSSKPDVREFLEHLPRWPESGALRIGGWIAIVVGVVLAGFGAYWYLS
ncbi:MAG: hypothetical protein HYX96_00930 [Chloroflexi bacterium]|nr:hypothetical protein [Chloroflexota bacterium]